MTLFTSLCGISTWPSEYNNSIVRRDLSSYLRCVKISFRVVLQNIYSCSSKILHMFFPFLGLTGFIKTFSSCLNLLSVMNWSFECISISLVLSHCDRLFLCISLPFSSLRSLSWYFHSWVETVSTFSWVVCI